MTISATDTDTDNLRSLQTLIRAISLAQGQFSLIIVLCNHAQLQRRVWERLQNDLPVAPKIVFLTDSATSLYETIQNAIGNSPPNAAIVCGLESVKGIDELLASSNRLRDRFPKEFHFPIVLLLNEKVLGKMVRVAHDFYSWAGTPIEFCSSTEELVDFLQSEAQILFDKILEAGADRFLDNAALNFGIEAGRRFEIQIALRELARRGAWELTLEASQKFLLGRDAYASGNLSQARSLYEQSLELWAKCTSEPEVLSLSTLDLSSCWQRQACLLFHLGLWWRRYASENYLSYTLACQRAYDYYHQCLEVLKATNRPQLVAKFINPLGEILQQLERWDELLLLAKKALQLHLTYPHPIRLGRAYGFLAEVMLAKSQWEEAKLYAEEALKHNQESGIDSYLLNGLQQLHGSRYLLQLGKAHYGLAKEQYKLKQSRLAEDNLEKAQHNLEKAQNQCEPGFHPRLYIDILEELRSLYFRKGNYLAAFNLKVEQRSIEQQYGFRGFVGAGCLEPQKHILHPAIVGVTDRANDEDRAIDIAQEIMSSSRAQHVSYLVSRLQRNDYKITILYGPSGVGKSSLVNAGLIPALEKKVAAEGQRFLTVSIRVYQDWVQELSKSLRRKLKTSYPEVLLLPKQGESSLDFIKKQLKHNGDRHLTTVLVFDQFEEFFFNCKCPPDRKIFWEFLRDCLDDLELPYVNTIISIRQDYLHYLLECDRTVTVEVTKNDILNRDNRYYFGNLSVAETKEIINDLASSTYYLEPELADKLVEDLADNNQEIRPIELQIVGSQLENEGINSLVQYQEFGGKKQLIKRFLYEVIEDCGLGNNKAAERILYLLTDENGNRPLKSKANFKENLDISNEKLELILEILVKSGIAILLTEKGVALYQLVHDYLATVIRQEIAGVLVRELEDEKNLRQQAEYILLILRSRLEIGFSILVVMGIIAAILAYQLVAQRNQNLMDGVNLNRKLIDDSQPFEALVESVKNGRRLQRTLFWQLTINPEVRGKAIANLQEALNSFQESNRWDNKVIVNTVAFGSQNNAIATGSADGKITFWNPGGTAQKSVSAHQRSATNIAFSPDGKWLASTGNEGVVKLWSLAANKVSPQREKSYLTGVNSVNFSPDSRVVATAGNDGTINLWNWQTKETKTWKAHQAVVNALMFSPDGQMVASASADRSVKVWQVDGKLVKNLAEHRDWVTVTKFSHDGRYLISGSNDRTVKIWDLNYPNGKPQSLKHKSWVVTLDLTTNNQYIAVGTADGLITLWDFQAQKLAQWKSHNGGINSLNFSPDGTWLLSGGNDSLVKIWRFTDALAANSINTQNLDRLLRLSCDRLQDYLKNQPPEIQRFCP